VARALSIDVKSVSSPDTERRLPLYVRSYISWSKSTAEKFTIPSSCKSGMSEFVLTSADEGFEPDCNFSAMPVCSLPGYSNFGTSGDMGYQK